MNGYDFTERVRKVLLLAREASVRLQHEYVGTEHMLLGLIAEGEGVAAVVLQNLGFDLDMLRDRVEAVAKPGKATRLIGPDLPYTSRSKKALELAMEEARHLRHSYVGTEHLLLGLLREEKGFAAQVLAEAGASLDILRSETLRMLGTESDDVRRAAHRRGVSAISIEVKFADGTRTQEVFGSVAQAISFLERQ
ncbi:MAG: Clp protease N-terminal domain-containing protein [Gemmatimonas sp.]